MHELLGQIVVPELTVFDNSPNGITCGETTLNRKNCDTIGLGTTDCPPSVFDMNPIWDMNKGAAVQYPLRFDFSTIFSNIIVPIFPVGNNFFLVSGSRI